MRRRKSTKLTLVTMGIFALALVLAILAVRFLPIPAQWQSLSFFMIIPLLSFVGVLIAGKIGRR